MIVLRYLTAALDLIHIRPKSTTILRPLCTVHGMPKDSFLKEATRALSSNYPSSSSARLPCPNPSPDRQTFGYLEQYAACPIQTPDELMFTLIIIRTAGPCLPFTQALPQNTLPSMPNDEGGNLEAGRAKVHSEYLASWKARCTNLIITIDRISYRIAIVR